MKVIGIITIIFAVLSVFYLIAALKQNKISTKIFLILLFAFLVTILGTATLVIMNW